ncbi:MAG TPA: Rha family transcriptional regulator [Massilibacterium sp.]|nr:Rha family transcriptional regulator [Massilibacterium sp.]
MAKVYDAMTGKEVKERATIDTREVARMVGKEHKHLLRDIKGYLEILGRSNFGLTEFFIESTYTNSQNKKLPCYLVTRKGCEFIANKLTGEKGVLFTASYINRFHEMESALKPKTQLEILQASINQMVEQERKLTQHEERLSVVESKQENIKELLSLNSKEWRKQVNLLLNKIAKQRGGFDEHRLVRNESYQALEQRAKCDLKRRLENKKSRMLLNGESKSKTDKVNNLDVIEEDKRLTEIYLAIIKELAISYDVELAE